MRVKYLFVLIFILLCNSSLCKNYSFVEEEKLGKRIDAEIARGYRILDIPEKKELLEKICEEIGKNTERKEIKYKIRIIDETEINAFSIPGGYIYVTRAIFDFINSEDELAGILAHEIAHIVHQHSLKKLEKDKKLFTKTSLGALIAMLILDKDAEIEPIVAAANAIRINALSGYGREMEKEADYSAIKYLSKTKYNPAGYLTFMEKLLREEKSKPYLDAGIFKTHPDIEERVKDIIFYLKKLNIAVEKNRKYEVNVEEGKIFINDIFIFMPSAEEEGMKPFERAEKYAENLRTAIGKKISLVEWHLVENPGKIDFVAGDKKILTIYEKDAELQNSSLKELAEKTFSAIKKLFWEEFSRKLH